MTKRIGSGAYGSVAAATDAQSNGTLVAIKKLSLADDTDQIDIKRLLREMTALRHFSHENILKSRDAWCSEAAPGKNYPRDVYIATAIFDTDLHYIIHSKQALTDDHMQYFIYQILRALKALHSAAVMHRDLKPNNCFVNKNCDLVIGDLGLCRVWSSSRHYSSSGHHHGQEKTLKGDGLTEYVVTRWYRAPELLVENSLYDHGVDIWSAGCILSEMMTRKALFPGRDYLHQLRLIVSKLPPLTPSDLATVENAQAVEYLKALPQSSNATEFKALHPNANPLGVDLLVQLLKFNPSERPTAATALVHSYLTALHDLNDEPTAPLMRADMDTPKKSMADLCKQLSEEFAREGGTPPVSTAAPRTTPAEDVSRHVLQLQAEVKPSATSGLPSTPQPLGSPRAPQPPSADEAPAAAAASLPPQQQPQPPPQQPPASDFDAAGRFCFVSYSSWPANAPRFVSYADYGGRPAAILNSAAAAASTGGAERWRMLRLVVFASGRFRNARSSSSTTPSLLANRQASSSSLLQLHSKTSGRLQLKAPLPPKPKRLSRQWSHLRRLSREEGKNFASKLLSVKCDVPTPTTCVPLLGESKVAAPLVRAKSAKGNLENGSEAPAGRELERSATANGKAWGLLLDAQRTGDYSQLDERLQVLAKREEARGRPEGGEEALVQIL